MNWFVYRHIIISARPSVPCCVSPTVASLIRIVLDLLRLNSIYWAARAFVVDVLRGKMEGVKSAQ